jgi:spore maturation protein CgeB
MRILMFYHSLLSDWNHGNAHFLRGVATELISRGHNVEVFEPENSWSLQNLVAENGGEPVRRFHVAYPHLKSTRYVLDQLDFDELFDGADLVIVHEWNSHELVKRIGEQRARGGDFTLLFHDTHHRMLTSPENMAGYDLSNYDGVLAYGKVLQEMYESRGVQRAWTWHEAADTHVFRPISNLTHSGDLVWIGNWGDDERTAELHEFLIEPVRELGLRARVYGVRYPDSAKETLRDAGMDYAGWLPNFDVPKIFSEFKFTVHVPRRPYVRALRGIPTIRPFEAMACGIPLVSAPWDDAENLFRPGRDYLVARNGAEMKQHLRTLMNEPSLARELAKSGWETIREHHTCKHRVDELFSILEEIHPADSSEKLLPELAGTHL